MPKGPQFERDICHQLSLWWTGGKDELIFWRTAGSGGRMTNRAKKGKSTKAHCADIGAIDPVGQPLMDLFAIEAKRGYSKFTVADLLDKPDGAAKQEWEKWHDQVTASQARSGAKSWMLITKRDRREALVFLPWNVWKLLKVASIVNTSISWCPPFLMHIVGDDVIGLRLSLFLEFVTPDGVQNVLHDVCGQKIAEDIDPISEVLEGRWPPQPF